MDEPDNLLKRPNVTARALVEYHGKFLMLFAPWCKRWTLPGGRIDGTESVEQTIKRELQEEIGVTPTQIMFLGFGQGAQYHLFLKASPPKLHMICYAPISQEPTVDKREAEQFKWVTLNEMKSMQDKEDGIDDFFRRFPNVLKR